MITIFYACGIYYLIKTLIGLFETLKKLKKVPDSDHEFHLDKMGQNITSDFKSNPWSYLGFIPLFIWRFGGLFTSFWYMFIVIIISSIGSAKFAKLYPKKRDLIHIIAANLMFEVCVTVWVLYKLDQLEALYRLVI